MESLWGWGRVAKTRLGSASEDTSQHHRPQEEQSPDAPVAVHP